MPSPAQVSSTITTSGRRSASAGQRGAERQALAGDRHVAGLLAGNSRSTTAGSPSGRSARCRETAAGSKCPPCVQAQGSGSGPQTQSEQLLVTLAARTGQENLPLLAHEQLGGQRPRLGRSDGDDRQRGGEIGRLTPALPVAPGAAQLGDPLDRRVEKGPAPLRLAEAREGGGHRGKGDRRAVTVGDLADGGVERLAPCLGALQRQEVDRLERPAAERREGGPHRGRGLFQKDVRIGDRIDEPPDQRSSVFSSPATLRIFATAESSVARALDPTLLELSFQAVQLGVDPLPLLSGGRAGVAVGALQVLPDFRHVTLHLAEVAIPRHLGPVTEKPAFSLRQGLSSAAIRIADPEARRPARRVAPDLLELPPARR